MSNSNTNKSKSNKGTAQGKAVADAAISHAKVVATDADRPDNAEVVATYGEFPLANVVPCPSNPRSDNPELFSHVQAIHESMRDNGWQGPPMCGVDLSESPDIAGYYGITETAKDDNPVVMLFAGHCRRRAATSEGCGQDEKGNFNGTDGAPLFESGPVIVYRFGSLADFLRSMLADTVSKRPDALKLADALEEQTRARVESIAAGLDAEAAKVTGAQKKRLTDEAAAYRDGSKKLSTRARASLLKGLDPMAVSRLDRIRALPESLRVCFGLGLGMSAVDWVGKLVKQYSAESCDLIGQAIAEVLNDGGSAIQAKKAALNLAASFAQEPGDGDGSGDAQAKADAHKAEHNRAVSGMSMANDSNTSHSAQASHFKGNACAEVLLRALIAPTLDALSKRGSGVDAKARRKVEEAAKAVILKGFCSSGVGITLDANAVKALAAAVTEQGEGYDLGNED